MVVAVSAQEFTFTHNGPSVQFGELEVFTEFHASLENTSGAENPVWLLFDASQIPPGWGYQVCLDQCLAPSVTEYLVILPPDTIADVTVDLIPFSFGEGTYTITAYSELAPAVTISLDFTVIAAPFSFTGMGELVQQGEIGQMTTFTALLENLTQELYTVQLEIDTADFISGWERIIYVNGIELPQSTLVHQETLEPGIPAPVEVYITPQSIDDGSITITANSTPNSEIAIPLTFLVWCGTGVDNRDKISFPETISIGSAYPNPFNPRVSLEYHLSQSNPVNISVYNLRGELVSASSLGMLSPGAHTYTWDGFTSEGMDCPSGIYHIRIEAGSDNRTISVVKLK